jgi:hypothetical protein
MQYDYNLFSTYVINLLKSNYPTTDVREIGENISTLPNLKIIFDGYSSDVETPTGMVFIQQGNTNVEAWVMFVHKDALTENFVFTEHERVAWPEHPEELPDWQIVRRPDQEVVLWAWYNKNLDSWNVLPLEERITKDDLMNESDVMRILEGLNR